MVTVTSADLERGLRFEGDSVRVEDLPGEPLDEGSFTSVYYDTEDRVLGRAEITLRRRTEHGRRVWQRKRPQPDGRLELEEPGGPGGPPYALGGLLRARLRGRSLSAVATLRTHRSRRAVDGARVTLDQVEVLEGARVISHFSELEARQADRATSLDGVEHRLREAGARSRDGRSKVQRALETTVGKPIAPRLPKKDAPALELFRAYVAKQLDRLTAHDPAVRVGGYPEDIHDMRVAIRRLRAALKTAKPMLDPTWSESLRAELSWFADALAPARDLDVLTEHLHGEIGSLDAGDPVSGARLLEPLEERRELAAEKLKQALDSDRYLEVLDRIEAAADTPPTRRSDLNLGKRARRESRKLRQYVRSLGDRPSAAALHKTRIRAKRVRYATELAAGRNTKTEKRLLEALKTFQDALGEHQDAVVAGQELRHLANATRYP